jgi:hypothetical protein
MASRGCRVCILGIVTVSSTNKGGQTLVIVDHFDYIWCAFSIRIRVPSQSPVYMRQSSSIARVASNPDQRC